MWLSRRGRALSTRADGSTGQDPRGPPPRRESLTPLPPMLPLLSERFYGILSLLRREHCSNQASAEESLSRLCSLESFNRWGVCLALSLHSVFPLPGRNMAGVRAAIQVEVTGSLLHSRLASCLLRVSNLESQDFVAHGP